MIDKRAIEKSIEGGWKVHELVSANVVEHIDGDHVIFGIPIGGEIKAHTSRMFQEIALDPSFWQALGKALGWEEKTEAFVHGRDDITTLGGRTWLIRAFQFYDLILTSGDTQKFWDELLKGENE